MTPLHWAAHGGHEEACAVLLERGAPPMAVNADGWTPLHYASCSGHTHVARALVRAGGDASAPNAAGRTPLQVREACKCAANVQDACADAVLSLCVCAQMAKDPVMEVLLRAQHAPSSPAPE
jgi:hypothetical protein